MKLFGIASGSVLPHQCQKDYMQEQKDNEERRICFRHDYRVAVIGSISGGVMGLITSFIFWLITK